MPKLYDYASNTYSQFGDDGIIAKIFEIIGTTTKLCVEFGAWDGFYLSNTAKLWANEDWKAILIEGHSQRYQELVEKTRAYGCVCLQRYVSISGTHSLDNLLQEAGFAGQEIDLLSIDIDGDDYYIFESLQARPRLIVCEFNPTVPIHIDLLGEPGSGFGCSPLSLVKMAERKGYRLVAVNDANAFFVREQDFPLFADYETSLEKMALTTHLTYLMTDFSGNYLASCKPPHGLAAPFQGKLRGDYCAFPSLPEPTLSGLLKQKTANSYLRFKHAVKTLLVNIGYKTGLLRRA